MNILKRRISLALLLSITLFSVAHAGVENLLKVLTDIKNHELVDSESIKKILPTSSKKPLDINVNEMACDFLVIINDIDNKNYEKAEKSIGVMISGFEDDGGYKYAYKASSLENRESIKGFLETVRTEILQKRQETAVAFEVNSLTRLVYNFFKYPEFGQQKSAKESDWTADKDAFYKKDFEKVKSEFKSLAGTELDKEELCVKTAGDIYDLRYCQKLIIDDPSLKQAFVFGDIHASLHSLLRNLLRLKEKEIIDNQFKLRPRCFMFFLGDYVDRGRYSNEVLYLVMKLKLANPDKVFLMSGNHEEHETDIVEYLSKALFVGDGHTFIMLCHGGIDPDFSPTLLLEAGKEKKYLKKMIRAQKGPPTLLKLKAVGKQFGLHWCDFVPTKSQVLPIRHDSNRGYSVTFGELARILTSRDGKYSSDHYRIMALLRGHQHNPHVIVAAGSEDDEWKPLNETTPIRNNIVYTFMSAPEGLGGNQDPEHNFNLDGFGMMTMVNKPEDWTLTPFRYELPSSEVRHGTYVHAYRGKGGETFFMWRDSPQEELEFLTQAIFS